MCSICSGSLPSCTSKGVGACGICDGAGEVSTPTGLEMEVNEPLEAVNRR